MVHGDVHAITVPRRRGRVQHGRRHAVIVQADDLLALSTVVVCPTSRSAPPASFHPEITIGDEPTRIMCEMVGAVDARALGQQIGHLTLESKADAPPLPVMPNLIGRPLDEAEQELGRREIAYVADGGDIFGIVVPSIWEIVGSLPAS